jgi:hypothetical protein
MGRGVGKRGGRAHFGGGLGKGFSVSGVFEFVALEIGVGKGFSHQFK